jgi:hypothetical protein
VTTTAEANSLARIVKIVEAEQSRKGNAQSSGPGIRDIVPYLPGHRRRDDQVPPVDAGSTRTPAVRLDGRGAHDNDARPCSSLHSTLLKQADI